MVCCLAWGLLVAYRLRLDACSALCCSLEAAIGRRSEVDQWRCDEDQWRPRIGPRPDLEPLLAAAAAPTSGADLPPGLTQTSEAGFAFRNSRMLPLGGADFEDLLTELAG